VIETLVRIGRRAIVSFPNFGFWRIRRTCWLCRMPMSPLLVHPWYETPNIHLCTIRDFVAMCDEIDVRVERSLTLDRHGQPYSLDPHGSLANLLAEQSVFVLSERAAERIEGATRSILCNTTPPMLMSRSDPEILGSRHQIINPVSPAIEEAMSNAAYTVQRPAGTRNRRAGGRRGGHPGLCVRQTVR